MPLSCTEFSLHGDRHQNFFNFFLTFILDLCAISRYLDTEKLFAYRAVSGSFLSM